MAYSYPMMLDVSRRRVVIVGGGAVAVRKAQGLLAAGARQVCVIAPRLQPDMPANVEALREAYRPQHLEGAGLVFASTDDPAVNDAVVEECHRRGVLVCRADSDDEYAGDFATPAMHQDGALTITVSTAGSPALAARIRDGIAQRLDPRWAQLAEALRVLRPIVRASGLDIGQRRQILRDLAGDTVMDVVAAGGTDGLRRWLADRYPQLADRIGT